MKNKEQGRGIFVVISIVTFIISFGIGVVSKLVVKPSWAKKYSVRMSDETGKVYKDIPYGDGEANRFDLYVPAGGRKESYGLVVYLHAGGFTSGDKSGDAEILSWLCSKGYIAAGINYTLRTDENNKSVYSQSMEIKEAMLYAYRDAKDAPVPVKMMFEAVGPSGFNRADWDIYGLDQDTVESKKAAAELFSVIRGTEIAPDIIDTPEYDKLIKPVSAVMWIDENSVPSVIAYGVHDRVCPFRTAVRLVNALKENGVDYQYFEMPHSGHGLQNDDKLYEQYMNTVEEYLDQYMSME